MTPPYFPQQALAAVQDTVRTVFCILHPRTVVTAFVRLEGWWRWLTALLSFLVLLTVIGAVNADLAQWVFYVSILAVILANADLIARFITTLSPERR